MFESKCKSCLESVKTKRHVLKDEINDAIDKLSKNKNIKFVSDEVYEHRLLQCRECKYLELGTTCMQCGCFVEIRAKLRDLGCPLSKHKRWNPAK
ncbi:DUF6171 family protein [Pseudobacteroides cellulosolvens]|uniref:Uncharacterized protein n=1 Tax=Pseudobacteroides cellulosolvens ATCC 35603 = DSM 2933 TaxID=398512 RepID=A0A0L6JPP8_9FIRM|nr:DUF6171 family protein [Pseudobacteroides cellulosolvens]KNY27811.1 hypothetical protein Bccel_3082 [Pseudobacteroides cellulosolvens ATCC 35603 = DSM 2933]